MEWAIIDTGIKSAEENMRIDSTLLDTLGDAKRPILHLYEWQAPSATYGYFIDLDTVIDREKAKKYHLDFARRPTGGGVIFHLWDLAFSVLVPAHCGLFSQNTLDNYAFVNQAVLKAVKEFLNTSLPLFLTQQDSPEWDMNCRHFCMAKPTKYDVMWEGKKIAGAAQRKTRQGFLHQGSIALTMPSSDLLKDVLISGTKVEQAMHAHTYALLGAHPKEEEIGTAKEKLKQLLATHLTQASLIIAQL